MQSNFLFAQVLIVTHEPEFVRLVRVVLQNAGYTTRVLPPGEEILTTVAEAPPDLLLIDAETPSEELYALLRELRGQRSATRFVPLIAVVGREDGRAATAVLNAGADEVLSAPLSSAELLIRVRSMLRLKAITDELSVLNASLEEKVAERTQELEEAHATLRHTEKLSSLGRLAASVAHEINNPLTSLLSYVYLMKYELEEGSSLVKDLSVMERQINAIARLVRRLQDFSKPPRRERHPVQLSEVLEDVLTLLGKELEHQRVEVDYHQDEPLHPVLASPDQMGEVFMNLVLNARDAMPQGGELSLALENQEGVVVFRITDTGVGISPEVLDRLFEPFFTTKGDKGTGLGLAICYRIVEEHGGEMQVESAPGQGATFTIRLPALEEPQGQAHEGRGQGEGERDSHVH